MIHEKRCIPGNFPSSLTLGTVNLSYNSLVFLKIASPCIMYVCSVHWGGGGGGGTMRT